MSSETDMFDLVIAYGKALHLKHDGPPGPDGRAAWQPLKVLFAEVAGVSSWSAAATDPNNLAALKTFKAVESGEAQVEGLDRELAHFAKQILEIPRTRKCSFVKVMQVAYNYGQLLGAAHKKPLVPRVIFATFQRGIGEVCDMGAFDATPVAARVDIIIRKGLA